MYQIKTEEVSSRKKAKKRKKKECMSVTLHDKPYSWGELVRNPASFPETYAVSCVTGCLRVMRGAERYEGTVLVRVCVCVWQTGFSPTELALDRLPRSQHFHTSFNCCHCWYAAWARGESLVTEQTVIIIQADLCFSSMPSWCDQFNTSSHKIYEWKNKHFANQSM